MPFWFGAMGSHDDSSHQGSAKRDTLAGVAGLSAGGTLLNPGSVYSATRDGNGDIKINERTSSETAMVLRRTGANAYTLYNNTVVGGKIIQDSSMKDAASGIAGLSLNLGISGAIFAGFNLLHIADTNLFAETLAGTGSVTQDMVAGTITLNGPAANDIADRTQIDKFAFSLLPRILTFRVSAKTETGVNSEWSAGWYADVNNWARLIVDGASVTIHTKKAGVETVSADLTDIAVGDIITLVASTAKVAMYQNGVFKGANVANIPLVAVGIDVFVDPGAASATSLTLDFLSQH